MNKILPLLVRRLGSYRIRKGTEYSFKCPACNDTKRRMDVNLKLNVFHCFHCGNSGKIQEFLKTIGQEYSNGFIAKPDLKAYLSQRTGECKMPKGFTPFREMINLKGIILDFIIDKRKLLLGMALKNSWGYCKDNWRMRNRLIIPIIEDRKTVCWIARAIDGSQPKELSPEASEANKSYFLYGLDAISEGDTVLLVEGIFDCERMIQYGYKSVSALGSNLSEIQVGKLLAKKLNRILIMFDGDSAGEKGAWDAFKKLTARTSSAWVTICVKQYPGRDPDELTQEEVDKIVKEKK